MHRVQCGDLTAHRLHDKGGHGISHMAGGLLAMTPHGSRRSRTHTPPRNTSDPTMYRQGILLTWLASASTLVSGTSDSDMIVVLRRSVDVSGKK
jgi:hypothetical protein